MLPAFPHSSGRWQTGFEKERGENDVWEGRM